MKSDKIDLYGMLQGTVKENLKNQGFGMQGPEKKKKKKKADKKEKVNKTAFEMEMDEIIEKLKEKRNVLTLH